MNIRIPTRVLELKERQTVLSGVKDKEGNVHLEYKTLGWFVHFEGSREALFVGMEKPEGLDTGTEVDILIVPRGK